MKQHPLMSGMLAAILVNMSCGVTPARNNVPVMVKLTQYDRGSYCDLAVGPDGKQWPGGGRDGLVPHGQPGRLLPQTLTPRCTAARWRKH